MVVYTVMVGYVLRASPQHTSSYMFWTILASYQGAHNCTKRLLNISCTWLLRTPRRVIYSVYQNDWSGFEVDFIHKFGEQNYK